VAPLIHEIDENAILIYRCTFSEGIDFVQADEQYANIPHQRDLVGLNHFAFHGRSRVHIDEITNSLKERGIKILYKDQHPFAGGPNYYAVYFEDPNKFKLRLWPQNNDRDSDLF